MMKFLLATILCIYFATSFMVNGAAIEQSEQSGNETLARSKRSGFWPNQYRNYYYPVQDYYYYWYNWYPTRFAVQTCSSIYSTCPNECPGSCGSWYGLSACQCNSCPVLGDPCNRVNLNRGLYLHSYPYDSCRYVQCDPTPGVFYIRSCPTGLVFDHRFSVCNYAQSTFYLGKK